jgi:hypothetical protein
MGSGTTEGGRHAREVDVPPRGQHPSPDHAATVTRPGRDPKVPARPGASLPEAELRPGTVSSPHSSRSGALVARGWGASGPKRTPSSRMSRHADPPHVRGRGDGAGPGADDPGPRGHDVLAEDDVGGREPFDEPVVDHALRAGRDLLRRLEQRDQGPRPRARQGSPPRRRRWRSRCWRRTGPWPHAPGARPCPPGAPRSGHGRCAARRRRRSSRRRWSPRSPSRASSSGCSGLGKRRATHTLRRRPGADVCGTRRSPQSRERPRPDRVRRAQLRAAPEAARARPQDRRQVGAERSWRCCGETARTSTTASSRTLAGRAAAECRPIRSKGKILYGSAPRQHRRTGQTRCGKCRVGPRMFDPDDPVPRSPAVERHPS